MEILKAITGGVALGLVTGLGCTGCYMFLLLPVLMLREDKRFLSTLWVVVQFLLGRFVVFVSIGAALGAVGGSIAGSAQWLPLANIPIAALLLLYALRKQESAVCEPGARLRRFAGVPLLLGLLSAIFLFHCPALVAAAPIAITGGSPFLGAIFFTAFFIGSSVYIIPFWLAGAAARLEYIRRFARAVCLLLALFLLYQGLAVIIPPPVESTALAPTAGSDHRETLKSLVPEATDFVVADTSPHAPLCYKALDEKKETLSLCFFTADIVPEIEGYGGHIPLAVAIDRKGKVKAIEVLAHSETPEYASAIESEAFCARLRGISAADPCVIGEDVDAISGATVSVSAFVNELNRSLEIITDAYLSGEVESVREPLATGFSIEAALWLLLLLLVAAVAYWLRLVWLRFILLATSFLFFGIYLKGTMLSSIDITRLVFFRLPDWGTGFGWYLFVGTVLGSCLVAGRLFCGYICPFGAVSEALGRILPHRRRFSVNVTRRLSYLKYVVLFLVPVIYLLSGQLRSVAIEPFGTLFSLTGSLLHWTFLLFVLVVSLFVFRFFCRFLCPAGAFMGIISRARIFGLKQPDCERDCNLCERACRMDALLRQPRISIIASECINCNDCEAVRRKIGCSTTDDREP